MNRDDSREGEFVPLEPIIGENQSSLVVCFVYSLNDNNLLWYWNHLQDLHISYMYLLFLNIYLDK